MDWAAFQPLVLVLVKTDRNMNSSAVKAYPEIYILYTFFICLDF